MTTSVSKVSVEFKATDALSPTLKNVNQNINKFMANADKAVKSSISASGEIKKLVAGFVGVSTVFAAFNDAKNLELNLVRTANAAGLTNDELDKLKKNLFEISGANNIKMPELQTAVDEILQRSGDLKFAKENMNNMAIAMNATGASASDIGGIFNELNTKMGLKNANDVMEVLATLNEQGKQGSFTFKDLSSKAGGLLAQMKGFGQTGKDTAIALGAWAQGVNSVTTDADISATSMSAVLTKLKDVTVQANIGKLGVKVKENGEFRKINTLLIDTVDAAMKTGQGSEILSKMFDVQGFKAIQPLINNWLDAKKTGVDFKTNNSLVNFEKIKGDPKALLADASRAANTAAGAMNKLYDIWLKFVSGASIGPFAVFVSLVNSLDVSTMAHLLQTMLGLVAAFYSFKAILLTTRAIMGVYTAAIWLFSGASKVATLNTVTLTVANRIYDGVMKLATITTWLFSAALWANPLTWILAGVMAIVGALALLIFSLKKIIDFFKSGKSVNISSGGKELKGMWSIGEDAKKYKDGKSELAKANLNNLFNYKNAQSKHEVVVKVEGNAKAAITKQSGSGLLKLTQNAGNTTLAGVAK